MFWRGIQIKFSVEFSLLTAAISTFPFWSFERGDVCEEGPTSDRDGVSEPLETDGRLERVDVVTDGDLQPGG